MDRILKLHKNALKIFWNQRFKITRE